jgi:hypothetical protein
VTADARHLQPRQAKSAAGIYQKGARYLETANPLPALIQSLQGRITTDFGLVTRPLAERTKILERVIAMVMSGAIMRAADFLDGEASKYVDSMLEGGGENDPEKAQKMILYIASRVPQLGTLMDEAYEEVKIVAVQVEEKAREKKFEPAENAVDAAGDLWELVEDGVDAVKPGVPGLSLVGVGIDLFFDPARFRRSARERQKRFFKNLAVACGEALGLAWAGFLLFTIFDALERRHLISPLPEIMREAVPTWFERQSIGGQMLLLVLLAVGATLVGLVIVLLTARAGLSPRFTSFFEPKVRDDELASTVLKSSFLPSDFPDGVPQDVLWRSCTTVYRSVYLNSRKPNSDDLKILDEILEGGDEKTVVAFLKSKVRWYRSAMKDEAKRYCSDAADIMGRIK